MTMPVHPGLIEARNALSAASQRINEMQAEGPLPPELIVAYAHAHATLALGDVVATLAAQGIASGAPAGLLVPSPLIR